MILAMTFGFYLLTEWVGSSIYRCRPGAIRRWRSRTWNPFVQSPAFQEIALTGQKFGQTPSSLLEIRDWWLARELDIAAALYLHEAELKREAEREQRDREFWIAMFGGEGSADPSALMRMNAEQW